jgi:hypothetical protein
MNFEHFERGYLLPEGCKDLIDVINLLQARPKPTIFLKAASTRANQEPPINGDLLVSETITVGELASLLRQKPFKIIADLMQLGFFATVKQSLGFEAVSQMARKYGYIAKKLA